ncbi:MAG: hypothetical protein JWR50_1397 [Mucilaginibacter sp.]|nr:hypothetical protein [Mucilaginibacter sp.]
MQNTIKYRAFVLLTAVIAFSGCRKIFNLPTEKSYLSTQASYTQSDYPVILGRTSVFNNVFNSDNSTFPINFTVTNPRFGDGRDASDMLQKHPTLVWTEEYTGLETSLAQINAKRKLENHAPLEIRGNGDIMWWNNVRSKVRGGTFDAATIDTLVYPQQRRYFDVKLTSSGGARTIPNLTVTTSVDQPYTPNDDYNKYTGQPNTGNPNSHQVVHNYPDLSGIVGDGTDQPINGKDGNGLVYVYIRKFSNDSTGHRLRFKFLDKDSVAISPNKFGDTKWLQQVHGFKADGTPGPDITNEYAEYNVAYPIPLAKIPTKYTLGGVANLNGGDVAHVEFSYSRVAAGGIRRTAIVALNFQIFEPGDWEIVFHFKTVNPKFEND